MANGVTSETYFNALIASRKEFDEERKEHLISKIEAVKERADEKFLHLKETMLLTDKLNQLAVNKMETMLLERAESSNNKYALLKEQTVTFATNDSLKATNEKVDMLTRLVYIGLGGILVLQFILLYLK